MRTSNRYRTAPSGLTVISYLAVLISLVALSLTIVGSFPYLVERVVPEKHRDTVSAFGWDIPGVSTRGADAASRSSASGWGNSPAAGPATVQRGEWEPRHLDDFPPPTGLTLGVDFDVHTTDSGHIAHWHCGEDIPVWVFDPPPGSEGDIVWAVDTITGASGLPLRYAGIGASEDKEVDGSIAVTYGDHPDFHTSDAAGLGGPSALWADGRISKGSVVIRPNSWSYVGGEQRHRALILHEIMHAIGILHSAEGRPEVMAPTAVTPQATLGAGDMFALYLVGCH